MIKIVNLTVKNFMSVGNQTQAVNFDREDLTLVLGENLDTGGGDSGSRNGTGKTTILNALSYGLYGSALTNIKRDNLINKTNGKGMIVTVDFTSDGKSYRIERGRKPNVNRLFVDDIDINESQTDDAQGDSRETQHYIEEKILHMSHDMFKHIVALNTYTEPFLSLRANDQRQIIEQLLGITQLSEKADKLKEHIKESKDNIKHEEYNIKSIKDANARIEEQIKSLKTRQKMWVTKHESSIVSLYDQVDKLSHIDIDAELADHKALAEWTVKQTAINDATKWMRLIKESSSKHEAVMVKLNDEIEALKSHKCYACGQELHDTQHEEILAAKEAALTETGLLVIASEDQYAEHTKTLSELGELGEKPVVYYAKIDDAYNHKSTIDKLQHQLEQMAEQTDPYAEQILEMEETALETVSYDTMNSLVHVKDHQEFLQKLLTNKDSFIRKRIIDQNLTFLNNRLMGYLERTGLPHTVIFQNDLTVQITELGRDLDFDNLSRGERNRLILSLSWAFRDVWENLYQGINLLFIDEVIDSGMDANGVDNALGILKQMARERNKSIWLVSHKDELTSRVNNILRVVKENGFTNYSDDTEDM